jgi:hypothetical protein
MKTTDRLVETWERNGWTVTIEENANRSVEQRTPSAESRIYLRVWGYSNSGYRGR